MENTDKIKDMITLIEKNNENYHDALSNLADTFDKSLSSIRQATATLEYAGNEPDNTGEKQSTGNNSITVLGKLFSRKS